MVKGRGACVGGGQARPAAPQAVKILNPRDTTARSRILAGVTGLPVQS